MTVNDTERGRGRRGQKEETEGERKEKESWNPRYKEQEKKGHPHHQQLPPKLKAMVIKSYVAIREVECPPSSLKER